MEAAACVRVPRYQLSHFFLSSPALLPAEIPCPDGTSHFSSASLTWNMALIISVADETTCLS